MYEKVISGVCTAALVLALQSSAASADRMGEFSIFAGAHLFSEDNELGVADEPDADSLTNAVTFGIRAAFALTQMVDLEAELAITPTTARDSGVDVVAFGWRGSALFHVLQGRFRPFLLAGAGASTSSSSDERIFASDTDLLAHVGVGAKYAVQDNWGIRVDARLLLPPSSENNSVTIDSEFQFSLYKNFGPLPPPKPPKVVDKDGDGIPDEIDKCVDQAEDMDGFEDEDGCPDVDNDGDGIIDSADKCPDEAEDVDGFEDADGCPDLDNDNDLIPDTHDQCPNEAEVVNGFEDEDGCPDRGAPVATLDGNLLRLGVAVTFSGSNQVRNQRELALIARVMRMQPDVSRWRIVVAARAQRSEELTRAKSQAQADAVKAGLIAAGMSEDALEAIGAVSDSETLAFAVLERAEQDADEFVCPAALQVKPRSRPAPAAAAQSKAAAASAPAAAAPVATPVAAAASTLPAAFEPLQGVQGKLTLKRDAAKLAGAASKELDAIAALLTKHSQVQLEVRVHTDSRKGEATTSISQSQAQLIVDYLVGKGVALARLRPVGKGMSEPVGDNNTSAGRDANRRVELLFTAQ